MWILEIGWLILKIIGVIVGGLVGAILVMSIAVLVIGWLDGGFRENPLDLEYLHDEFTSHKNYNIKRVVLEYFFDRCEDARKAGGRSIVVSRLKTPEEKAACERDWPRLIEEAKRRKEKQERFPITSDSWKYLTAMVVGNKIHKFNMMIERFQEQLEAVRACQIERIEVPISDARSNDKWVVIHKNKEPISIKYPSWVGNGNKLFWYSANYDEPFEITERECSIFKDTPMEWRSAVAYLFVYEDGRTEELPVP